MSLGFFHFTTEERCFTPLICISMPIYCSGSCHLIAFVLHLLNYLTLTAIMIKDMSTEKAARSLANGSKSLAQKTNSSNHRDTSFSA